MAYRGIDDTIKKAREANKINKLILKLKKAGMEKEALEMEQISKELYENRLSTNFEKRELELSSLKAENERLKRELELEREWQDEIIAIGSTIPLID